MTSDVLRRKASGAAPAVALAAMTPARALRLAVAKAGDVSLGVTVAAREIDETLVTPDTAADGLPDPALYLQILDESGRRGVAVMCPQALAAVIEARTMATVLTTPAEPRRATATDGVMVAGWIAALIAGAAALSADCTDAVPGQAVPGTLLPGPGALALYLADVPAQCWRLALDFADGAKTGTLWLILPGGTGPGCGAGEAKDWQQRLGRSVLGASARLEAVLGRLSLPIDRVATLSPGDVLPLGQTTLDDLVLVAPGGARIARGRLGRANSRRAVRLRVGDRPEPAAIKDE